MISRYRTIFFFPSSPDNPIAITSNQVVSIHLKSCQSYCYFVIASDDFCFIIVVMQENCIEESSSVTPSRIPSRIPSPRRYPIRTQNLVSN